MATTTMKALNYLGPYQVRVEDVEKPRMEHPDDVVVKVTTVSHAATSIEPLGHSSDSLSRLRYVVLICSKSRSHIKVPHITMRPQ